MLHAAAGRMLMMLGWSGTLKRVLVRIVRLRSPAKAWSAALRMKRETPLMSPSVSVKRRTRGEKRGEVEEWRIDEVTDLASVAVTAPRIVGAGAVKRKVFGAKMLR